MERDRTSGATPPPDGGQSPRSTADRPVTDRPVTNGDSKPATTSRTGESPSVRGDMVRPAPVTPTTTTGTTGRTAGVADIETHEVRNRVQWGPIVAGTITGLVTLILLSVLGLAVGASAFEPGTDLGDWGTAAAIWGAVSALIAFFAGGWVAAKTAAVRGSFAGAMNGLMAGAAILLVMVWLTTTGLTNLLGFVGANVADMAAVTAEVLDDPVDDVTATAEDVQEAIPGVTADDAFAQVERGAWGTVIALILALGAATLGGVLGRNEREDLTHQRLE
jgi:hypothetical protein